jgi:hypothetical protein
MTMLFSFTLVVILALFTGGKCENQQDIEKLDVGVKAHGEVGYEKWKYYRFTTPAHKGFTLTIQHSRGTTGTHDIDVYVRKGLLPDRANYDYKDINVLDTIVIDGLAEAVDTDHIVGIYGFSGTNTFYTLILDLTNGCPQNCNQAGTCLRDNTCACNYGRVGAYCQYNSTSVVLGTEYNGHLQQNSWLYYSVDIWAANNIQIEVTQNGGDVDLYLKHQVIPDFVTYDYADVSASPTYTLTVVEPVLGTWHLGFYAFSEATFTFKVSEQRSCPMKCSLHGSCVGSMCNCQPDYAGLTCEESRTFLNSTPVHGYVDANYWNFYKFVAYSNNPFLIKLQQKPNTNCDLFVMNGAKPTKFVFQYANETAYDNTEILVSNPGFDVWWVGVYGSSTCEYDISLEASQIISICNNCIHGVCKGDICECTPGSFGRDCSVTPTVLQNAVRSATYSITGGEWQYFTIKMQESSQISIVVNEKSTTGLIWFYVNRGDYPTLSSYESSDSNSFVETHRLFLEYSQPKSADYVIGIYGSPFILSGQLIEYSLVAFYTPF